MQKNKKNSKQTETMSPDVTVEALCLNNHYGLVCLDRYQHTHMLSSLSFRQHKKHKWNEVSCKWSKRFQ